MTETIIENEAEILSPGQPAETPPGGAIYQEQEPSVPAEAAPQALALQSDEASMLMSMIEKIALSPDADKKVAVIEKMLDMQERVLDRNAKQAFAADFAAMQAELPEIEERGKLIVAKSKDDKPAASTPYATFEDINRAVKPIMEKFGFGIIFKLKQEGTEKIRIQGILTHKQGHSEETEIPLPYDSTGSKNAVQAVGSTVSYGKRYVLCALLNITTRGMDDDGKAGGDAVAEGVIQFQADAIKEVLMACSEETRDWFMKQYGAYNKVPRDHFTAVLTKLQIARSQYEKKQKAEAANAAANH